MQQLNNTELYNMADETDDSQSDSDESCTSISSDEVPATRKQARRIEKARDLAFKRLTEYKKIVYICGKKRELPSIATWRKDYRSFREWARKTRLSGWGSADKEPDYRKTSEYDFRKANPKNQDFIIEALEDMEVAIFHMRRQQQDFRDEIHKSLYTKSPSEEPHKMKVFDMKPFLARLEEWVQPGQRSSDRDDDTGSRAGDRKEKPVEPGSVLPVVEDTMEDMGMKGGKPVLRSVE
ncbi:hypothetical protein J4E80_003369 [Alternaria sp. BMP 0032]|nr:hypothetical protein J4E80_003369 [Alternaria sp. BMP 0032]